MKKLFFITVFLGGILSACSTNSKENNTHQHEDGSTHEDHAETTNEPTKQEEFSIDSASTDTAGKSTPHVHDESKPHSH